MKIYTVKEVAEILKVTERTIYRYLESGDLPASKVGRYWRIQESDIKKFLEDNRKN